MPPTTLPPITPEQREYVRAKAPGFARSVARARSADADDLQDDRNDLQTDDLDTVPPTADPGGTVVLTSLAAFRDDPRLLYACLWLADTEGVGVTFAPVP